MLRESIGLAVAVAAILGIGAGMSQAQTQSRLEAGTLYCKVAGGTGLVFGSTKDLECIFNRAGATERYAGTIMKYGIDIGSTSAGVIVWNVLSSTAAPEPGALTGTYSGLTTEATVGVGVGINALLGGNNQSVVLQPVSEQAQQGLNLAVGIASIKLEQR